MVFITSKAVDGYNTQFLLYPRPLSWWKHIFAISFVSLYYGPGLYFTHCYKTAFLHLYLQFFC